MKKIFFQKNKKAHSGFTLVETLVAISIFTVSLLGLVSISAKGLSDTGYAKRKIVATYLAQEGVEYVKNMRDTYMLYDPANNSQTGWNDFMSRLYNASCATANGCYFGDLVTADFTNNNQPMVLNLSVNACGSSCPSLFFDQSNGKYNVSSVGVNSGYVRKIRIENQYGVNELKISSTVFWTQGSGNYSITFTDNVFNWIE